MYIYMRKSIGLAVVGAAVILGACGATPPDSAPGEQSVTTSGEVSPPTAIEVDINSFIAEFDKNQLKAETEYKGKVIRFSGWVDNISEDITGSYYVKIRPTDPEVEQYYFKTSVQCFFDNKEALLALNNGDNVHLEGVLSSQTLGTILLRKCIIK